MKTRWMSFGVWVMVLLLSACGGEEGDSAADTLDKPTGGKADDGAIGELCVELGLEADCDLCEEAGWYGDGECDDFCAQPDPDCGDLEANDAACAFDLTSPVGDTSSDLDDLITGRTTFTADDIDELSVVQTRQIGDAFVLLDLLGDEDFDAVFDIADEGTIDIIELDKEGARFDWVSFFAGDTEVGVVYEANTLNRVGEISDGDIKGCGEVEVPDENNGNNDNNSGNNDVPGDVVCDFDSAFPVADNTGDLEEFASNARDITDIDVPGLSELEKQQIFGAAVHLQAIVGDEDFDVVFDAVDDGGFTLSDIEAEAGRFDWVTFFLGDTEVGVIYDEDTLDIVAEISDGDILGCVPTGAGE